MYHISIHQAKKQQTWFSQLFSFARNYNISMKKKMLKWCQAATHWMNRLGSHWQEMLLWNLNQGFFSHLWHFQWHADKQPLSSELGDFSLKWVKSLTAVKKISVGFQLLEKQSCNRELFFRSSFSMILYLFWQYLEGNSWSLTESLYLYSTLTLLNCPYTPVYTLVKSAWMDINHSDAHSSVEKAAKYVMRKPRSTLQYHLVILHLVTESVPFIYSMTLKVTRVFSLPTEVE